jgi:Leucine-rich repeat (LRR) protein
MDNSFTNAASVNAPSSQRRWFRFSLRTLMLVMTVLGCGLGWVMGERAKIQRHIRAMEDRKCAVGSYLWSKAIHSKNVKPDHPAWARWLFGDIWLGDIEAVLYYPNSESDFDLADQEMVHLREFPNLRILDLCQSHVTDLGLANLSGLKKLERLTLYESKITDTGLQNIVGLKSLEDLDLQHTSISDVGLVHLSGLSNLSWLELGDTQITDK